MEKKKTLEQAERYVQKLGLTSEEMVKYSLSKDVLVSFNEQSQQVSSKKGEMSKKVLPGMYVYADGLISSEFICGRQVKAVVGYIEGDTAYAVCLRETRLPWSKNFLQVPETRDMVSGKEATREILEAAQRQRKLATAVQWCYEYAEDGVKQGEGFLPSQAELEKLFVNKDTINESIKALGAALLEWGYWSSIERFYDGAWIFDMDSGRRIWCYKNINLYVRPVLAISI